MTVRVGELHCQKDAYCTHFETRLISCEQKDNMYHIILEDTILFPTGGGQPFDLGTLNDIPIVDCQRQGMYAVHITHQPILDEKVMVVLDWNRRFDHMQQHSGQHLISDIAEELFEWKTFGWSLGPIKSFVEFEQVQPSDDALDALESRVNSLIREALPQQIQVFQVVDGRPNSLPQDIQTGVVRHVAFGPYSGPCCGTHVRTTAEIQGDWIHLGFKWLHVEKVRGGNSRMWFLCGNRVFQHLKQSLAIDKALTNLLSSTPDTFADRVAKKIAQVKELTKEVKKLKKQLPNPLPEAK